MKKDEIRYLIKINIKTNLITPHVFIEIDSLGEIIKCMNKSIDINLLKIDGDLILIKEL